jgi:hypothetical protein
MEDGSIAPPQDVRQHEGKALLPSAFARLNGKSAVHQQINFGAKHECLAALLKIAQLVTQYGEIKRIEVHKFGVRLMPELYDSLYPMTCKRALQAPHLELNDSASRMVRVAKLNHTNPSLHSPNKLRDNQSCLRSPHSQS